MRTDLRFALRTLRTAPVFTLIALLSLGLGIGANTAIFSLIWQVALRSLPVAEPARLVSLQSDYGAPGYSRADNTSSLFSYPMYRALRNENSVFAGVVARSGTAATVTWKGNSDRTIAEVVSGDFFDVLGVRPAVGRLLTAEDEVRREPVIVLGYQYWSTRLGSDPRVLNSQIRVNGQPMLVVGVAARGFRGVISGQTPDVYAPLSLMTTLTPSWRRTEEIGSYWLNLFARLKPGVSFQQANSALAPLFRSVLEQHLEQMSDVGAERRKEILSKPLRVHAAGQGINMLRDTWQGSLLLLAGMVGAVLLVACANVASLMVVRASARQRELALRAALGASGWRIGRLLIVESMLLALMGGILGAAMAAGVTHGLLTLLPEDATGNWLAPQFDWRVFGFSMALATITGLLFGAVPALGAVRADPAPAIKQQSSGVASGEGRPRIRQAFVAAQICLSFLLLAGAALFLRTLNNLASIDPGFRPERLATFSLDPVLSGYKLQQARNTYGEIEKRLAANPQISSVAYAALAPFGGSAWGNGVRAPGTRTAHDKYVSCLENAVGPGYFRTLGIPLVSGREFDERDLENTPKVAVVNDAFARQFFETADPIGRIIQTGSNDLTMQIVGVVKDSKFGGLRETARAMLYVPYDQAEREIAQQAAFFVRAKGDERQVISALTAAVKEIAPGVPVTRLRAMRTILDASLQNQRMVATLATVFALLATLLAAVGVYGAAAYSSARRTREFGIRLALGAPPASVLRVSLHEALVLIGVGIGAGLPLTYALARVVQGRLYGVAAHDPAALAAAAVLIAAVAAAAALRPGLHAMRTDPVNALRHE